MKLTAHHVNGVFEVEEQIHRDLRGTFHKTYMKSEFSRAGMDVPFVEHFVSNSHRGVIRGMHFQVPPKDLFKLVTCVAGEILDVFTDLRLGSPHFGKTFGMKLSAERGLSVLLPPGIAHGFLTLSPVATVLYNTTAEYSREHDAGIRWDTLGFDWLEERPVLSERDKSFPTLAEFQSPFRFQLKAES